MTVEAPPTVRDVLRLLLAADSYPRLGNHDWREADLLTAEALQKARTATPCADDPPEFAPWTGSCAGGADVSPKAPQRLRIYNAVVR